MHYTIGDGFKLGCGLILAATFGLAVLALLIAVGVFLSTLLGYRPPFPTV